MYSASLAARHCDGLFVSGFGFAASYYGLPDIGFIAWPDMVAFAERLRGAFPRHHLLVDIDDGCGDPEPACHVVRRLERAGLSGVVPEDQRRPHRCGHADGKQVLPLDEHLEKLNQVLASRTDLLVVARTDATDEEDLLIRAKALAATDADVVLVDGVRSVGAIRRIRDVIGGKPLLFNRIAGGKSPRLSPTELAGLGVGVAIYSTPCLFAAHRAMEEAMTGPRSADGCLPAAEDGGGIGASDAAALLTENLHRHSTR